MFHVVISFDAQLFEIIHKARQKLFDVNDVSSSSRDIELLTGLITYIIPIMPYFRFLLCFHSLFVLLTLLMLLKLLLVSSQSRSCLFTFLCDFKCKKMVQNALNCI